jgi:hypothetical protein
MTHEPKPSLRARLLWLVVFAVCAAGEMLLGWLKEHAQSKIKNDKDEKET